MNARLVIATVGILAGLSWGTAANAQCGQCRACRGAFLESVANDFAERNRWPYPYVCPDREAVKAPFGTMIQNGWRRQNMLSEEHFKDNGIELTEAGRLKVQRIMTEVPLPHRMIFVHRADTPEKTASRLEAVQRLATKFSPDGSPAIVQETTVSPGGWPADRADAVNRKFHTGVPAPQLPPRQTETESK